MKARLVLLAERVKCWICGLRGHDPILSFERGRLSIRCASCEYESEGWDLP